MNPSDTELVRYLRNRMRRNEAAADIVMSEQDRHDVIRLCQLAEQLDQRLTQAEYDVQHLKSNMRKGIWWR